MIVGHSFIKLIRLNFYTIKYTNKFVGYLFEFKVKIKKNTNVFYDYVTILLLQLHVL